MGKKLVIEKANFSKNGLPGETYISSSTTVIQGLIVSNTGAVTDGKLSPNSASYFIHSNLLITLEPGDMLVTLTDDQRMAVFAYTNVTDIYPALVKTSEYLIIGTMLKKASYHEISNLPIMFTNTGSSTWYIVLACGQMGVNIKASTVGKFKYRIYTNHPENYLDQIR